MIVSNMTARSGNMKRTIFDANDCPKPNAQGSDIEAWLLDQQKYRETHTADYMTDYQARPLNTRVRRQEGTLEFVHTNDPMAFACGRTMVAIIENFQNDE